MSGLLPIIRRKRRPLIDVEESAIPQYEKGIPDPDVMIRERQRRILVSENRARIDNLRFSTGKSPEECARLLGIPLDHLADSKVPDAVGASDGSKVPLTPPPVGEAQQGSGSAGEPKALPPDLLTERIVPEVSTAAVMESRSSRRK